MARPIKPIELSNVQRHALMMIVNRPTSEQRMVRRARIILCRAEGMSQVEVARKVGVRQSVVSKWDVRFGQRGIEGLCEARRSGRQPSLPPELREGIVAEATRPPAPRQRWSLRSMARAKGIPPSTVHRLWRANDIKPHLTRSGWDS